IIAKEFVGAAAANHKFSFNYFTIWHWDNDAGGYNEAMDFDVGDRKFKTINAGRDLGVEQFHIFLGKEYKVSTLAENFEVYKDQTQTLGKPVFYVPKDRTITVDKHATLVIDGVLLLDGTIKIEEGGLLKLKDGAKVFPLTKYDNECGQIDSSGDIVIGTGAVLCGGPNNGIRIGGGGVVNFGVLCGEYIQLEKNDLVDNRVEEANQGWVIAGKSLTGAARSRFVKAAILNEDTAKLTVDRSKDFATLSSTPSFFSKQLYSVYGDGAANVDTSGVGKTTIGSASNPTLSVYTSDKPGEKGTALFENEMLDEITLRVSGTKAIYTVRGEEKTAENKLITATIGRGTDKQTLFRDMWVGKLNGAYVQLEPASARGTCLAASGTGEGANVQLGSRDMNQTVKGQWWKLTEAGKEGLDQTYYLESFEAPGKSLDLPGNNTATNGTNVTIWTTAGDTGTDRRWIMTQDAFSRNHYFFRNVANTGVSLEADGTAAGANVRVATNEQLTGANVNRQRWTFVNLFDEESYGSSLTEAAAMEIIPQNATTLRLDLGGAGIGASARVSTADSNRKLQRWELRQAGADNVNGTSTPYFRVVNKESGKALTVNGDYKNGTCVAANNIESGSSARAQYWYLESAGGANQYYLKSRGDSNYALTATGTGSGSAVQISAWVKTNKAQMWEMTGGSAVVNQTEQQQKVSESDPFYGKVFQLEPNKQAYTGIMLLGSSKESNVGTDFSMMMNDKATDDYDIHKWSFKYAGKDNTGSYYQIVPAEGNLEVAIGLMSGQKMQEKGELALVTSDPSDSTQLWRLTKYDDWTGISYKIIPKDNQRLSLGVLDDKSNQERYDPIIADGLPYSELWKFIEAPSMDGKIYAFESVGYQDASILPYGVYGGANRSLLRVLPYRAGKNYTWWKFEWVRTEKGTPYYKIISAYKSNALFDWRPSDDHVLEGDLNGYNPYEGDLWAIRANNDGTVCIISYADKTKALQWQQLEDDPYVTLGLTKLGTPTDDQKWKLTEVDPNYDPLDGRVFTLRPMHDSNLTARLDVESYSVSNGTKMVLYDKREHESQRWRFECVGTATKEGETVRLYCIHSVYAKGKTLDTPGGTTSNNTRAQIWDSGSISNNSNKWIVQDAGSGYYYIIPYNDSTKALACAGAGKTNGTAVTIYDNNGQDDIKWKLEETMAPAELGTYELEVVGAAGMSLDLQHDNSDNGTWAVLWPSRENEHARWTFIQMGTDSSGDPYYKIVNKSTGKVLDVNGSASDVKEGAYTKQYDYDYGADQLWYLDKAGTDDLGDYYYIRNKVSWGYKLATENAKYSDGTYIVLTDKQEDNAKWRLNTQEQPVSLGVYEFGSTNAEWLQMRMDVTGGSTGSGANMQLWHRTNTVTASVSALPGSGVFGVKTDGTGGLSGLFTEQVSVPSAQTFEIIQRGKAMYNGEITPYYSIQNTHSGLTLDAPDTGKGTNGANIQQWSYDGYADQHWFLEIRGDNSVVFRNRSNTDLVLASNILSDGGNIRLETYNEGAAGNQRWFLHPIMLQNNDKYYVPGNAAAAAVGIPFVQDQDVVYDPAVGGNYTLTPMHKSGIEGQRMDLSNGSTSSGTSITAVINNGANAQRWKLIPSGVDFHDGDGKMYYRIASKIDNNCVVDVQYSNMPVAGNSIRISTWDGCYDQLYYLEEVGGKDDTFYLIARGTLSQAKKICLEVSAGAATNGAAIKTATKTEKTYQQWQLDPVD
ncbi:MAG: RICIN domain-containing protein, partial [Oscillospiraceae bacterium]|nr:RICIN domain-containing protein [Oscillospiraceae bacterium]